MILIDGLLISGLRFVLDKLVAAAADAELTDDGALRARCWRRRCAASWTEISEEEFLQQEAELAQRIRGPAGGGGRAPIAGVGGYKGGRCGSDHHRRRAFRA